MFFLFKKIILIFNTLIIKNEFFGKSEPYNNTKFILDISGDIIAIIGFLIYLEIIVLNFWNLDYNVKQNIIKRGIEETENFIIKYNDDDEEEEKIELNENTKTD